MFSIQKNLVLAFTAAAVALPVCALNAQTGPERTLAGITIGRPVSTVFQKYGNPTRVETSSFTPGQEQFGGAGVNPFAALLGGGSGMPSDQPGGIPAPGAPAAPGGSPGDLGGALGSAIGGLFGLGSPTPAPAAAPGIPGQTPVVQPRPITKYYYDYAAGPALVFTVGEKGMVEQIDAYAPWPWSPARTRRGINIGAKYSTIVGRYGYPDSQRQNADGTFLMNYAERANVAFTLLGGQVVGVSVALVE